MSETMIQVNEIGKRYRIGRREPYQTMREALVNAMSAPLRRLRSRGSGGLSAPTIWALKDVSFEVKSGEVLGIIGRNGAGKSTLLKILSRITEPTEGFADVYGRVGSLLEVGTGFHKELSGRENIYMNGALLGMRRAEIARKFEEIVAFSGVEDFLDTPVKRYSSGMYMRLAFSVAAHLEPQILVVDEVLAVGDASFQKKCLGKMGQVARAGRTVLFVSHNMAAVQSLCHNAMWLDRGRVVEIGPATTVVRNYLASAASSEVVALSERTDRAGDGSVRITSIEVVPQQAGDVIRASGGLKITLHYESRDETPIARPRFLVAVRDFAGTGIFLLDSQATGGLPDPLPPRGSVTCLTGPIRITAGRCHVDLGVSKSGAIVDWVDDAVRFDVEADDFYGTGKVPGRNWVMCVVPHDWHAGS